MRGNVKAWQVEVALLLMCLGLFIASLTLLRAQVPADVDHYEVAVFREPPVATQASTPFSRTVVNTAIVKCGYGRGPDPLEQNVPNPTTLVFDDPGDATKDCRVTVPSIALSLPLGVNYRAAMRAVNAAGVSSDWGFARNTFRRAPRGLPCPNGQPGILVQGEADLNGKPVQIAICVNQ